MYNLYTLQEITNRIEGKIITEFSLKSPVLRVAFVKIFARVMALAIWLMQDFIKWIKDQMFTNTADTEGLEDLGFEIGVTRKPATFARGVVRFTGINGAVIPQQTVIARVSDNYTYITEIASTIENGIAEVKVVSELVTDGLGNIIQGVGQDANTDIDTECELTSSVSNVDTDCIFIEAATGGIDEETDEEYKKRIQYKKQNSPNGGSKSDYVIWASSRPGVTDVFVNSNYPTVNGVYVTIGNYTNPKEPAVTQDIIDDVQSYLNDPVRRPVTSYSTVVSVVKSFIDIEILISPLTDAIKTACDNQLNNLFRIDGTPTNDSSPEVIISKNKIISELAGLPNVVNVEILSLKQDSLDIEQIQTNKIKTAILRSSSYNAG